MKKDTRANHGVAGKPALLFVTASCQRKWAKLKRRYIIALAVPLDATAFFANAGSAGAASATVTLAAAAPALYPWLGADT